MSEKASDDPKFDALWQRLCDAHAAEKPPDDKEPQAWQLMGDAFVKLMRSEPAPAIADVPHTSEWLQAIAVADWLYHNVLTPQEQREFTEWTGWLMGAEIAPTSRR